MEEPSMKVCNTCHKELPINLFHKQSKPGRKYTRRGKCSICYSTYRKEMGWEKARYERKKNESVVGVVVDVMDDGSRHSPLYTLWERVKNVFSKCKIKTPQSVK